MASQLPLITLRIPKKLTGWGLPHFSPFCVKLEMYLLLAGLPFVKKSGYPGQSPKGMIPYIELEGRRIGDSQLIIECLKQRFGDPLDAHLSEAEMATGHLVRRTLEEGTYWPLLSHRWHTEEGFALIRPAFLQILPGGPLKGLFLHLLRHRERSRLRTQGAALHSRAELESMALQDVVAVVSVLGSRPYLLGDNISSFDCTVYSFLSGIAFFPLDQPARSYLWDEPRAMDYLKRITERCFPNFLASQFPAPYPLYGSRPV